MRPVIRPLLGDTIAVPQQDTLASTRPLGPFNVSSQAPLRWKHLSLSVRSHTGGLFAGAALFVVFVARQAVFEVTTRWLQC